jgi:hypothetical protein
MKIDFDEIETAFLFVSMAPQSMNSAFVDTQTGQTYYVSGLGDSDELPEDIEDDRYVELPHKNDLDLGRQVVRDFVASHAAHLADQVDGFFRRKGAYARFKGLLQSHGLLDDWHRYEETRSTAALKEWCAKNGIEISE